MSYSRQALGGFARRAGAAAGGGLYLAFLVGGFGPVFAERPTFEVDFVRSTQRYEVKELRRYSFVHLDRDYVFTELPPCLEGNAYVVTANSDKFDSSPAFLRLNSEVPVSVYVGYDERYPRIPEWLRQRFVRVRGARLEVGDPDSDLRRRTRVEYELYKEDYPPGQIILGGNLSRGAVWNFAMYTVVLVETARDACRSLDDFTD